MAAPDVLNIYAAEPLAAGGVYVAPLATPKPATAITTLSSPWIALGHIGEDGVTETQDRTIDKKKNWGGATVKLLQTDYVHHFSFTFLESLNAEVLKVVYGEDNVTVSGDTVTVTKNADKLPKATWCFDSVDTELGARYRQYIPIGQIMTVGPVTLVHTNTIEYTVDLEAFPDSTDNFVHLMTDLSGS